MGYSIATFVLGRLIGLKNLDYSRVIEKLAICKKIQNKMFETPSERKLQNEMLFTKRKQCNAFFFATNVNII